MRQPLLLTNLLFLITTVIHRRTSSAFCGRQALRSRNGTKGSGVPKTLGSEKRRQAIDAPSVFHLQTKIRREHVRWLCLVETGRVRPELLVDLALLAIVRAVYADATIKELRRELDYLAMQNLLTITSNGSRWQLKPTYQGVDVVEFTSPCPSGVGRPAFPD